MPKREGFAVVGLGHFGSAIARTLAAMDHYVVAVDRSLSAVEAMGPDVDEAVQADATERETLAELGIGRYPAVFNTIGDLTASILCTLALRELGVDRILAKINSRQQGRILTRLGVDELLFPERDMGERLARQVGAASTAVTTQLDLARDASLLEIVAPTAVAGRSLAEAGVRQRYGVTVVAVKPRAEPDDVARDVLVSPPPDTVIGPHDLVLVAGRNDDLLRFQRGKT